jgi:CheY-like chemotaxis protein
VINDILDFSKIEAGRLDLERITFNLRETVEGVIDTVALRASAKGLEVICLVESDVPLQLRGDPGRLRQVLLNLLYNAVKFTHQGDILVRVSLEEPTETNDSVICRFTVMDSGIGVPEERRAQIFDAFTQVDGSSTRSFDGTGLGLNIAKQLTEMMGGRIGVESNPEGGSSFWFTARFERRRSLVPHPPLERSSIDGLRILVVDDNPTNRLVMTKMLANWGTRIETAANGVEALARLEEAVAAKDPFALVLLDLLMPNMDGRKTAEKIHADARLGKTAVVMLTSIGRRGDVRKFRKIGVRGYLTKPIKQSQLLECILQSCYDDSDGREESDQRVITRHSIADRRFKGTHILVVEDKLFNQKLVIKLLKKMGVRVTIAADGQRAVEAVKKHTFDLILMDIQMPVMDGFQATRAIRSMEQEGRRVPIIAMTAHALHGFREACLDMGMNDYLTKPLDDESFYETIGRWVDMGGQAPTPGGGGQGEAVIPADNRNGYDLTPVLQKFSRDQALVGELAEIFLHDTPQEIRALDEALAAGRGDLLAEIAHGSKGVVHNFGLHDMGELFQELEAAGQAGELERAARLMGNVKVLYRRIEEALEHLVEEVRA